MGRQQPLDLATVTAGDGGSAASGRRRPGWPLVLTALVLLAVLTAAATAMRAGGAFAAWEAASVETSDAEQLRLGYFGNLTHAPALVGVDQGLFADALGDTELSAQVFTAGPTAVEAMNAGSLDAAFIGPNPAINSFAQSGGESLVVVAGAASGGAQFVVRGDVAGADDLAGRTFATPEFGGTQDVALRTWLAERGYGVDGDGERAVGITPMPNGQTLQTFQQGRIDGAWVPQPWAALLLEEAGAEVLVDERDLWEDGRYPTTVLAVRRDYLEQHPETVQELVDGLGSSVEWLRAHEDEPATVAEVLNRGFERARTQTMPEATITEAMRSVEWTTDPMVDAYPRLLAHAVAAGATQDASLEGLVDTRFLGGPAPAGEVAP